MIVRKNVHKRKHSINEKNKNVFDKNDTYVAYVKKILNNETEKNIKSSSIDDTTRDFVSIAASSSMENSLINKMNRKKNIEVETKNDRLKLKVIKSTIAPEMTMSIYAKPKIIKSNTASNTEYKTNKTLTKIKKNQHFKKYLKQKSYLNKSNIKIVMPQVRFMPSVKDDKSNTSETSPFEFKLPVSNSLSSVNSLIKSSLPIIVKANLKKSSNSYIPKLLQYNKEIIKECEAVPLKLSKIIKDRTKLSKYNSTKNKSITSSSKLPESRKDSKSDIPKALEEFYNEVISEVESVTNTTQNNKSLKNKSTLTVDKSVIHCNNLVDIVQKNSAFFENLSFINQINMVKFYSLENKVILILSPETQFSFLGKLKLKVLYGAVELYGCIFDPQNTIKPVEIYSPKGYSSITISIFYLDGTYNKEALWDALTIEGVDKSLNTKLHDIIKECKHGWSVLLLKNFENTLTNFLNNYYSFKLFPKIENMKYSWCDSRRAEYVLQANFQFSNSGNEISISPQWNKSITKKLINQWNSTKFLCTMIIGGKSVGKSTTARYLINNLLRYSQKVILLDLDPGQAEMTPAACLSLNIIDKPLLGPNFTHLKTPFYQLYLEDINAINCITRYINCIKKLVKYLKNRKDLTQYPVIVNTMGFCKGIGLDICIFLIKLIEPNNIIQIISKRPKNNFDYALMKQTVNECKTSSISWENDNLILENICEYEFHYIPSMAEGKRQFETWNIEPRQQRELVLLSYLSQIIENADNMCFYNFTLNSINNIIPYTLPFSTFYISLLKSSLAPTHILAAMNGNIVALCGIDLDNNTPEFNKKSLRYPVVVIKPPPCTCYGYGIVRGIDLKKCCIYINTPLCESELCHVNLLAGCSAMPFALLHSGERATAPYAGDRGELPMSREARRGYFRIDYGNAAKHLK